VSRCPERTDETIDRPASREEAERKFNHDENRIGYSTGKERAMACLGFGIRVDHSGFRRWIGAVQHMTLGPGRSHQQDLPDAVRTDRRFQGRKLSGWVDARRPQQRRQQHHMDLGSQGGRKACRPGPGRCPATDCEWGTVPATVGGDVKSSAEAPINSIGATFAASFKEARLTLRLVAMDKLTAHVDTHFQSGRPDFEATNQFVRVVTAVPAVNLPPSISSDAQASAAEYEKRGFVSLLDQNFDQAFKDFNDAVRLYPDLHNVQEIRNLMRGQRVPLQANDPASWKTLFSTILEKYSWGMPAEVKSQMQAKL
jgi:hypothetical protein